MKDEPLSDDESDQNEGQSEVLASVFYRHTQPSNDVLKSIFGEKVFPNPKDHEILGRLIRYVTAGSKDCIVLDSFAGSGSTGHAVVELNRSDGGTRRFVLVEMDEKIAREITSFRLRKIMSPTVGEVVPDKYGRRDGFRFCILGDPLFDVEGNVSSSVTYADLAAHVFFCETGTPIPRRAVNNSPIIGTFRERAIYLLHASHSVGVASPNAGNVLTASVLDNLPQPNEHFAGPRIVYAEGCTVPNDRLIAHGVTFKQVPYQIEGL